MNTTLTILDELTSTKFIVLYVFLGCGLFVHYRGQVTHSLQRQLLDHSTFFAPYNVLMYLFSSVPMKPFLDIKDFPHLKPLRDNWETFRDEALELYNEGHISAAEKHNDIAFNSFFRTGWKRFYIKWYDNVMPSAEEFCPKSVEIVRSIPEVNAAMFAMLPPDGRLGEHRDPFAGSLRYHLGLSTPNSPDCYIKVDGQSYWWQDGKDVIFDETYIHQALNATTTPRLILFCDVTRPLKYRWSNAINQFFIRHIIKASTSQNTWDEKVGLLNKIARIIFELKEIFQTFKQQLGRPIYYGIKYTLLGYLLYHLFVKNLFALISPT